MICFISNQGALSNQVDDRGQQIPMSSIHPSLRARRVGEVVQSLATQGIDVTTGGEGWVAINLRNLAINSGSIERGQAALYAAFEQLGAVALNVEAHDVPYITGNNVMAHALARALESNLEPFTSMLSRIEPSELFDRLNAAESAVARDTLPADMDPRSAQFLREHAESDLIAAGLLDRKDLNYRDSLDRPGTLDPIQLTNHDYVDEQAESNWKSPFDYNGGY